MYISLYHGRTNPNQNMDFWGTYGPVIGPVNVSITYGQIKVIDPVSEELEFFQIFGDMIFLDGVYYADLEIWDNSDEIRFASLNRERTIDFSEFKKLNNGSRI